jgi:hypothetical protein
MCPAPLCARAGPEGPIQGDSWFPAPHNIRGTVASSVGRHPSAKRVSFGILSSGAAGMTHFSKDKLDIHRRKSLTDVFGGGGWQ